MSGIQSRHVYFHVIMAWGADPAHEIKKEAIAKAAKSAGGIDARFPDYALSKPTFALDTLINELKGAAFVLADLSFERPSCYYEIGVVEAVGISLCVIAEKGTTIHQTTHREAVIAYDTIEDLEQVVFQIILDRSGHAENA